MIRISDVVNELAYLAGASRFRRKSAILQPDSDILDQGAKIGFRLI